MMTDTITIRPALTAHRDAILNLLPLLADFDVPPRRDPRHLWEGDAELMERVLAEHTMDAFADVAVDAADSVAGVILVSMRPELLSHSPSAHLEAIVVAPAFRGIGLGRRLLQHAERRAAAAGAHSLTLHVFANNTRARALYDASGYDSELIRAIKWLPDT